MPVRSLLLEPQPSRSVDADVVRSCRVTRVDNGRVQRIDELWFQYPANIPLPDDHDCDSYLLALLMDAMQESRSVAVRGRVSRTLLSNLTEFQAAWSKWLPETFAPVDIEVDTIREEETPAPGAVCAFSGGVDATFTVWRHTQGLAGYRAQDIRACAIVHGFDIPLQDTASFERALSLARTTLADVGVDLVALRTNIREISRVPWLLSFATSLVASLNPLRSVAGTCLIGSSEPYEAMVFSCGSNPVSDPLLGSEGFRVIHDGASHSRTEKIQVISDWETGIRNLRVCWEGEAGDRNCGHCEKCLRTILNFLANGRPIPACFPRNVDLIRDLGRIRLGSDAHRGEWRQLLDAVRMRGLEMELARSIEHVIGRRKLIDRLLPRETWGRRLFNQMKRGVRGY